MSRKAPMILRSVNPERRSSVESVDSIGLPRIVPRQPREHQEPQEPRSIPTPYFPSTPSPTFTTNSMSSEDEDNKLTLASEINKFRVGQDATITVSINNTSANAEKNAFYINASTDDDQKVVIKSYGRESDVLENLVTNGSFFKFTKLKVKNVSNPYNSDVNFDFLFTKDSKGHCIMEIESNEIVEFDYLRAFIGRDVKISGTVFVVPKAGRNSHVLEIADPHGVFLQVRINSANFFIEAIKEGRSYSFFGKLKDLGNDLDIIDHASNLTHVDGRAFEVLPNLRKIKISSTSLQKLPELRMFKDHILTMDFIDFSNNRISYIKTGQFSSLQAKVLRLSGNEIKNIEKVSFSESKFVSLLLNDNPELTFLDPEAFKNIALLQNLNLSGTLIDTLPVEGLKNVTHLVLRNVPNLKKLPPVLAFNNLNKADFTYPYHCCFFKYANREYQRGQGAQYSNHYKEIQQRSCKRKNPPNSNRNFSFFSKKKRSISAKNANSPWFDIFGHHKSPTEDSGESDILGDAFDEHEIGNTIVVEKFDEEKYNKCIEKAVEEFYSNINCSPMPDALNPCEDIVGYPWLRYLIWVIWVMAIIGNILVWIVIITIWHRRSRLHYFFMINLSIADFLTGIYLGILAIQDARTSDEYYNFAVEWQTGWVCSFAGFLSVFASELSVTSMLMIAFEIYYNARFAFYGKRISSKNAYSLMGVGYCYALIMAGLPLIGVSSYERTSICLPLSIKSTTDRLYLLFGLSVSLLCFGGMVLNYVLINLMIRNPGMPTRAMDTQIFRRSLILITTNMVCWIPVLFFGITATIGVPLISLTNAKICLILFYPINSCANPYLYVFLTQMGTEAKKKAIKNIIKNSSEKSSFYYSQSPGERETLRNNEEYSRNTSFLQVTMTTSLGSSPRGSSASSSTSTRGSMASEDRKNSQLSFQEHVLQSAQENPMKRNSRPRVSAAPEMSVINHIKSALNFYRRKSEQCEIELPSPDAQLLKDQRPSTSTSIGQDSGLGISVHSKRFSSSSNETQEDQSPKFLVNSLVIQKAHHHKNPQHPDTPTLMVSRYSSFDIEEDTV
ncbi:hypothetical protein FO519_007585 [Halicephalobus sp. NKZ332]|nr:hypothetical protein FO519_007585 [Halicephalobus sp. NKZ332]